MIKNIKDEWETPKELFDKLDFLYKFTADACATSKNKKCKTYFKDALSCDWYKTLKNKNNVGAVFMNPPYSNPKPFLTKAWHESKNLVVVCLVPNNILTCKYMDIFDTLGGRGNFRDFSESLKIRFLPRRTRFYHPSKNISSPPGGCMVLIMDRRKEQNEIN